MGNILKELNISSEKYKSRIIYTYKYIALQKEFDVMTLLFNKIELNECLHYKSFNGVVFWKQIGIMHFVMINT